MSDQTGLTPLDKPRKTTKPMQAKIPRLCAIMLTSYLFLWQTTADLIVWPQIKKISGKDSGLAGNLYCARNPMLSIENKIIKASFRECPISDRKQFKQSHCLLPISIGQAVHEGRKFLATIKLINASFERCTLLVDDTVQWHTLKIDHPQSSKEMLIQLAHLEGNSWLERNMSAIKSLDLAYTIVRWSQWHNNPNFEAQYAKVEHLYKTEARYKAAVDLNIEDYLERYLKRNSNENFDYHHAFSCCLDYLKEECAVMTLWTEGLYDFEVYPTGRNKAMAATYEYLIQPQYPHLLKPVALRFKKYPTPLTVSFEASNLMPPVMHQPYVDRMVLA